MAHESCLACKYLRAETIFRRVIYGVEGSLVLGLGLDRGWFLFVRIQEHSEGFCRMVERLKFLTINYGKTVYLKTTSGRTDRLALRVIHENETKKEVLYFIGVVTIYQSIQQNCKSLIPTY